MGLKNKVQLIAYVDCFGAGTLRDLDSLLTRELQGLFAGVHLLPFFHAFDGVDTGFDPIDHLRVDERLGNWDDVRAISHHTNVVADLIVNHISSSSPQFQDYMIGGDESEHGELFVSYDRVFPGGATSKDILSIYRPRPQLPFSIKTLKDGSKRLLWTTFTSEQIDIDLETARGRRYLKNILKKFAVSGVSVVRLDAIGYAVKRRGTNCFMLPETFELIRDISDQAHKFGIEVLVEIHSHYSKQIEIARVSDWVYDFALPPLILHSLFAGSSRAIKKWLSICPGNSVTVLDTHDGIGITDVAADAQDPSLGGLLSPTESARLVETIHLNSNGSSRSATGDGKLNLDSYQVNCTYFDALGGIENDYLIARLIQLFAPGIPQVYYVGLLAGENDMTEFRRTGSGRDVNRRNFDLSEIRQDLKKPVVSKLLDVIRFRNSHPAFDGKFVLRDSLEKELILRRENAQHWAELHVDLASKEFTVSCSGDGARKVVHRLSGSRNVTAA